MAKQKYMLKLWGPESTGAVRRAASEDMWRQLPKWNRAAMQAGKPAKVFVASLADVFEDYDGPVVQTNGEDTLQTLDDLRKRLFENIAACPWLRFLLLTKRPENINQMLPEFWAKEWLPDNVWIGTTAENQEYLEKRLPHLLAVKARVRFLSIEPMLGPVDLFRAIDDCSLTIAGQNRNSWLQWVIAGGETQTGARPMRLKWVRDLRDQCAASDIAFHFKQWGNWAPHSQLPEESRTLGSDAIETPDASGEAYVRLGKQFTGRLLDGREWNDDPLGELCPA